MIELKLIFDPNTGQVQVAGPIDNKLLCYGILERAKDAIRDFNPAKQGIVLAGNRFSLNGGSQPS